MITQNLQSIEVLGIELSPVTFTLLATIGLVLLAIGLKRLLRFFPNNRGARTFYNRNFMVVVFCVFFVLAFAISWMNIPFDDPMMLLFTTIIILMFVGWSFISDTKALQILLIAMLGSFLGNFIATMF